MKKSLLLLVMFLVLNRVFSQQLQLELQSSTSIYAPVKLSNSGYKYYQLDATYSWTVMEQSGQFKLYNLDGTLFKTFALPPKPSTNASIYAIFYVSETLFDTDPSNIEYMLLWATSSPQSFRTQVAREDGTLLLDELNASTVEFYTTGKYISVFETDQGTKLQLAYSAPGPNGWQQLGAKIFILPGSYPTGINPNLMTIPGSADPNVFPNPTNGAFTFGIENNNNLNLEFFSMDGKKLKTYDVGPDNKVPDLGLPSGEYLIRANDQKTHQTTTKKII
ncbi:MAG TPA: T9SS type A sorting domain-containing protein, partial [Bacteroidia bacterium]|nr:T9SS type A sorting domain-containing protein [Bacteroidia bacterium]